MKNFILKLSDIEHKNLKVFSAKYGITMKDFIKASLNFYIDSLKDEEKKSKQDADKDIHPGV